MGERFTDEELAFLRHARFGELPERVRPEEYVELTEADAPPEVPPEIERFNYYLGQPG